MMRWRLTLLLGLVAVIPVLVYLLPQTPAVRELLLRAAARQLQQQGIQLGYQGSSGNPWHHLQLAGITLRGNGFDLRLRKASIGYFLPAIIGGTLPLTVNLEGLRGNLELDSLDPPTNHGSLPLRLTLRDLTITDSALTIDDAPYTLPGGSLEGLRVRRSGEGLAFEGILTTKDGRAEVTGHLIPAPFQLTLESFRADAALARHWWPGIEAGTVTGTLSATARSVEASATIDGGSLRYRGTLVQQLQGTVDYRHPLIQAKVKGEALGGRLEADVEINTSARRWSADLQGDPELKSAIAWAVGDDTLLPFEQIPLSGTIAVEARAMGWTKVAIAGSARGSGILLRTPLEQLESSFSFESDSGPQVRVASRYGEGTLVARLEQTPAGMTFNLESLGAAIYPGTSSNLALILDWKQGGVEGTLSGDVRVPLPDRTLSGRVQGQLREAGWNFTLTGEDDLGAEVVGSLALRGGKLSSELVAQQLRIPQVEGEATLTLQAAGPLDDLPFTMDIAADEPLSLRLGSRPLATDLRGRVRGTLSRGKLEDLALELGTLTAGGALSLSPLELSLSYSTPTIDLPTPWQGTVSVQNGRFTLAGEEVENRATLAVSRLSIGPVSLPPTTLSSEFDNRDGIRFTARSPRREVAVDLVEDRLQLDLDSYLLEVPGGQLTASGRLRLSRAADGKPAITAELGVEGEKMALSLVTPEGATGSTVAFEGRLEEGFRLAGRTLGAPLLTTGTIDLDTGLEFTLQVSTADLEASLDGRWQAGAFQVGGTVVSGEGRKLEVAFQSPASWQLRGELALAGIAEVLGLDAAGSIRGELSASRDDYRGTLEIQLGSGRQVFSGTLSGSGRAVTIAGDGAFLGIAASISGEVLPHRSLQIIIGNSGTLHLQGDDLQGEGALPALELAGFGLTATSWTVTGNLREERLRVSAGKSTLEASWRSPGWELQGAVVKEITWQGLPTRLELELQAGAAEPEGSVRGQLALAGDPSSRLLEFSGTLREVRAAGDFPAALLTGTRFTAPTLLGKIGIEGRLSLAPGIAYELTGTWSSGEHEAIGTLEEVRGSPRLSLTAPGLDISYQGGDLQLLAKDFQAENFLSLPVTGVSVTGELSRNPTGAGWQGELTTRFAGPLPTTLRLLGQKQELGIAGSVQGNTLSADFSGSLLPTLQLQVDGGVMKNSLRLQAIIGGPLTDITLQGTIGSRAAVFGRNLIEVDPIALAVTGRIRGNRVTLDSEAGSLSWQAGVLTGALELPVSFDHHPHLLSLTVSGSPRQPQLTGDITGDIISGRFQHLAGTTRLDIAVDIASRLELPPNLPLSITPLSGSILVTPSGTWNAVATLASRSGDIPLTLDLEASGRGGDYRGKVALGGDGPILQADLTSEGGWPVLEADLSKLDMNTVTSLLPFPANLVSAGMVRLETADGLQLSGGFSTSGSVGGLPLEVSASASAGTPFNLQASLGDFQGNAVIADDGSLRFTAGSAGERLDISGSLDTSTGWRLQVTGSYADLPVNANAAFLQRDAAELGSWELVVGRSRLGGTISDEEGGTAITAALTAAAELLPFPLTGGIRLDLSGGRVILEKLELQTRALPLLSGNLHGEVWPSLELAGKLEFPERSAEPLELTVTGNGAAQQLQARWRELVLTLAFAGKPTPSTVRLEGTSSLPLPGSELTADLGWSEEQGYAGGATLTVNNIGNSGVSSELNLIGQDDLGVQGSVVLADRHIADIAGELTGLPWEVPEVAARWTLAANLAGLWPGYPGNDLELAADLTMTGSLSEPHLNGPLTLQGDLAASGMIDWGGGSGRLDIEGEALSLKVSGSPDDWNGSLQVEQLSLPSPLLALLPFGGSDDAAPKLTLVATASGRGIAITEASIERGTLDTSRSRLSGSASLGEELQATLDLDADLKDVTVPGIPLVGRVAGTLTYNGAPGSRLPAGRLAGKLTIRGVGLQPLSSTLAGTVEVAGSLDNPTAEFRLEGEGGGSGGLRGSLELASRLFTITSDLVDGPFASDFTLTRSRSGFEGTGWIRVGRTTLTALPQEGSVLQLRGGDALEGWRVGFDERAKQLWLRGELSSLASSLGGSLELSASLSELADTTVAGALTNLSILGAPLGDVAIASPNLASGLNLSGEALQADLFPFEGFRWRVARLDIPVAAGLSLSASAEGSGGEARGSLLVSGEAAGESIRLPIALELSGGTFSAEGRGEGANGSLDVDAGYDRSNGWRGGFRLSGLTIASTAVTATATVSGVSLFPTITLEETLEREGLRLSGSSRYQDGDITVEQVLAGPLLRHPLTIRGTAWPYPKLQLGSEDGTLFISRQEAVPRNTSRAGLELEGSYRLAAQGRTTIAVGPLQLELSGETESSWLAARLSVPALQGFLLAADLPPGDRLLAGLREEGLVFQGQDLTSGRATIELNGRPSVDLDLSYAAPELALELVGKLGGDGEASAALRGELGLPAPWGSLAATPNLPFTLELRNGSVTLDSSSGSGSLSGSYDLASGASHLTADLQLAQGNLGVDLSLVPELGPAGTLTLQGLTLEAESLSSPLGIDADITVTPESLAGSAELRSGSGQASFSGRLGLATLLPQWLAPQGVAGGSAELRVAGFDLAALPMISSRLPHLSAVLSGMVEIRDSRVTGNLQAQDAVVGNIPVPLALQLGGSLERLVADGTLAASPIELTLTPSELLLVAKLESFPAQILAQAVTGRDDVTAEITGVLRAGLFFADLSQSDIRLATESIVLERDGVVTRGNLTMDYFQGALTIQQAAFEGRGRWRAAGVIRPDELTFTLEADDADFTPLLDLLPAFARLRTSARGSLAIQASGSLERPQVTLTSPSLEVGVAGMEFELRESTVALADGNIRLHSSLVSRSPVAGRFDLNGAGLLQLPVLSLTFGKLGVKGSATAVPFLKEAQDLQGNLTFERGQAPRLELSGGGESLLSLTGTLAPLELRLSGRDLAISVPELLLADGVIDADLLLGGGRPVTIGGEVMVKQASFRSGIRPSRETTSPDIPAPASANGGIPLEQLAFDDIHIRAPQRITFQEAFGQAELQGDLLLGGTAVSPRLDGTVQALRGSLRFSGREFELETATATFQAARGIYPSLEISARTSFDTARVKSTSPVPINFLAPAGGNSFEVTLSLSGEVEAAQDGEQPFRLDLKSSLTSNALIEQQLPSGMTSGARSLSEAELLSLIAAGRLDMSSASVGDGNDLAAAVAQGALDTAIDVAVIGELQSALTKALGVDLVEIRTSSLSSVLEERQRDPFGISFRVGGYLNDEVFASYRIGSFIDEAQNYALTNELSVTYDFGPLTLDFAGSINVDADALGSTVPEFSLGLRYRFQSLANIETGIDLSSERQEFRFGVSLRW